MAWSVAGCISCNSAILTGPAQFGSRKACQLSHGLCSILSAGANCHRTTSLHNNTAQVLHVTGQQSAICTPAQRLLVLCGVCCNQPAAAFMCTSECSAADSAAGCRRRVAPAAQHHHTSSSIAALEVHCARHTQAGVGTTLCCNNEFSPQPVGV